LKISTVLQQIGHRAVPIIQRDDRVEKVVGVMVRSPHTRQAYVVDSENRLIGTVSLRSVLRHLFPHYYEGKIHGHGILGRITSERAEDLMDRKFPHAALDNTVVQVLKQMAETGAKEMAVLDDGGRILAEVTAVDLLKCHSSMGRNDQQADNDL